MKFNELFPEDTPEQILQSLEVLKREIAIKSGRAFDLKKFCHPKQYKFATDPHTYSTAVTSRRAGKTVACAADLLNNALINPEKIGLYITLSRVNAKRLFWPTLKSINSKFKLGGVVNESDLNIQFPNKSVIYLAGVKDKSEVENFRGMALKKVYLDEAQSMPNFIESLIDDVLDPTLIDHNGDMRVIGTPSPVPVGYFHDIAFSTEWSHHDFTIWDNPHIRNPKERLEKVLKRRGITVDHPSIQREWFGRWALDVESLVFKYSEAINDYENLPTGVAWEYVISIDFGHDDADAIATLAFNQNYPNAYLVEEKITTKQGITPLAEQIIDHIKRYKPMKVIGDFGALGKKIAVELQTRFGIPIEAAEKARKLEYIELLNDTMRSGRLKAKKKSHFAHDCMLVEWDKSNPEKPDISDRYHSDICDALLYGHRELLHWLWKEPEKAIKPGTQEFADQQIQDAWQQVRDGIKKVKDDEVFWQDPYDHDM